MSEAKRTIKIPDGWQPRFEAGAFPGLWTMTLTDTRRTMPRPDERVTEAEAHFAMSKLLEKREEVDAAILNMRTVLTAFATPEDDGQPRPAPEG